MLVLYAASTCTGLDNIEAPLQTNVDIEQYRANAMEKMGMQLNTLYRVNTQWLIPS